MPMVAIDCPYCLSAHIATDVTNFEPVGDVSVVRRPKLATHQAMGHCASCSCPTVLFFRLTFYPGPPESFSPDDHGNITNYNGTRGVHGSKHGYNLKLTGVFPEREATEIPDHLPPNVRRALMEAEKCRKAKAFSAAAACYRKTVDRAVTPLVDDAAKKRMLGQKLANLEGKNILPQAMLDWVSVVKNAGNLALHDDEADFEQPGEIRELRDFTHMLLTYLYTMPEKVKIARGEIAAPTAAE